MRAHTACPVHEDMPSAAVCFHLGTACSRACSAHRAADLQSSKLKHVQEQNHSLTREKESLMHTIQDLKARIKQGVCGRVCQTC